MNKDYLCHHGVSGQEYGSTTGFVKDMQSRANAGNFESFNKRNYKTIGEADEAAYILSKVTDKSSDAYKDAVRETINASLKLNRDSMFNRERISGNIDENTWMIWAMSSDTPAARRYRKEHNISRKVF